MDSDTIQIVDRASGEVFTVRLDEDGIAYLSEIGHAVSEQIRKHKETLNEVEMHMFSLSDALKVKNREDDYSAIVYRDMPEWLDDLVEGILVETGGYSESEIKEMENKPRMPRNRFNRRALKKIMERGGKLAIALESAQSTRLENKITWKQ